MSRLPRASWRLQLSSGLQDTITGSPMSSPSGSHTSNGAASWTGRGATGEKKRGRGAPDTLQQELLTERQKDVARLQEALRLEQENRRHLQSRCSQQAWELQRKERQNGRLKERLARLLDRPRERKHSMDMLNGTPRLLGKGPPPRDVRAADRRTGQEVALRVMLDRQEMELRQALTLRHDLCDLLRLLRTLMEQTFRDAPVAVGVSDCERLIQLEEELGDHVTGGVVQAWDRVQRRFGELVSQEARSSSSTGTDQEKLLEQLKSDLEQSRQLVRLQQQVLQDSVNPLVLPTLTDSYYLEEWERLQAKCAELEDQRRSFQRERQAFTEAAIRLGHERWQFEQQKAVHLAQQVLCHSPWHQPTHGRRESSIVSHRTYSGSPAASPPSLESGIAPWTEHGLAQTPSTPELYSALQLPFHPRRSRGTLVGLQSHERRSHGRRSLECSF